MIRRYVAGDLIEHVFYHVSEIIACYGIGDTNVTVTVGPLTPEEAIGRPERRDFPILVGREKMMEARVLTGRGQAFTDAPSNFSGTLSDVIARVPASNRERAVFIAVLNALLAHLERVRGTIHCKNEDPELCASEIAGTLKRFAGVHSVGLVGLNPAIADHLIDAFGADNVRICDLNPDQIGRKCKGVGIEDGSSSRSTDFVLSADMVLVTGTCLVNDTFEPILRRLTDEHKPFYFYGVTCSGVCAITGLPRICPMCREGR